MRKENLFKCTTLLRGKTGTLSANGTKESFFFLDEIWTTSKVLLCTGNALVHFFFFPEVKKQKIKWSPPQILWFILFSATSTIIMISSTSKQMLCWMLYEIEDAIFSLLRNLAHFPYTHIIQYHLIKVHHTIGVTWTTQHRRQRRRRLHRYWWRQINFKWNSSSSTIRNAI